eukprot:733502-Alexandrium_andersonii.AAC.1
MLLSSRLRAVTSPFSLGASVRPASHFSDLGALVASSAGASATLHAMAAACPAVFAHGGNAPGAGVGRRSVPAAG